MSAKKDDSALLFPKFSAHAPMGKKNLKHAPYKAFIPYV